MALVVWNPLCYRLNRQIHLNLILFAFAFDCLPFGVVDDSRQTNQHTALSLLNRVWFGTAPNFEITNVFVQMTIYICSNFKLYLLNLTSQGKADKRAVFVMLWSGFGWHQLQN